MLLWTCPVFVCIHTSGHSFTSFLRYFFLHLRIHILKTYLQQNSTPSQFDLCEISRSAIKTIYHD